VLDAVDRGASGDDDAAVGLARDALELRPSPDQLASSRPLRVKAAT
jgi:hypothetical protein